MRAGRAARRLAAGLIVVMAVSLLGAFLLDRLPGGSDGAWGADPTVSAEDRGQARAAAEREAGWALRYGRWLARVARLDLGTSRVTGEPVASMIGARLPATLELMAAAILLALPAAVGIGAAAASRRGGALDRTLSAAAVALLSVPTFWLALLLISLFAVRLGWLPAGGRESAAGDGGLLDHIAHLLLPAVALAAACAARWSLIARASFADVLAGEAWRAAHAKGLAREALWWRHAALPALPPVITVAAMEGSALLGGALVTETVFGWPGIGRLFHEGLGRRDDPRLMGILVLTAVLIVAANLAADLLHGWLDPRVRDGRAG